MYKVFGDINSGNCYKIKLLLSLLDLEHEWIHIDILAGESQTTTFKSRSPLGKIPVLELPDGTFLSESNAILNFLAHESRYLPASHLLRARVLQWQFFEQYSHEPYIAVARFIAKYLNMPKDRIADYEATHEPGYRALAVMELQLAKTDFLIGQHLTIADISLYAYTHVAGEGGFDLQRFPALQNWLARVADQPRHISMNQSLQPNDP